MTGSFFLSFIVVIFTLNKNIITMDKSLIVIIITGCLTVASAFYFLTKESDFEKELNRLEIERTEIENLREVMLLKNDAELRLFIQELDSVILEKEILLKLE